MLTKVDKGGRGVSQMLTIVYGGGGRVQEPLILADVKCEQPLILIIALLQYSHCTITIPHRESLLLCYCVLGNVNPYSNWTPNTIQCPFTHQPEGLATPI